MTAHRIHTAGNARTHNVAHGYQSRPRVPGPIARPEGDALFHFGIRTWMVVVTIAVAAISLGV